MILTKTEILLSSSVVVFSYYIVIFFNILLCFVFDLDSGFCSVHVQNVTLLFFFFFRKILIRSPSYFRLFFFFFRKILVPFTCLFSKPYFVFPIIFSFAFLNIWKNNLTSFIRSKTLLLGFYVTCTIKIN